VAPNHVSIILLALKLGGLSTNPANGADAAAKAAVNPNAIPQFFETNLKECRATLP
jgi:hypothetical protein